MVAFALVFLLSASTTFASIYESTATSMVPYGKMIENMGRDYVIKTYAGTKIQIEFGRDGKLKEASGKNLNKGDDLEPGEGLISLSSIAHNLQSLGFKPEGFWVLENDHKMGWIYELNAQHIVCAKTGKVINK